MGELMGLVMREAGRSVANAMAEVREAIDFLRYYAGATQTLEPERGGLGVVACISPWNFPLAIFTGQVAAALAAGNAVLAKPAEETSLIAAEVVRLLHGAGIPADVLQLIPGDGAVGAALVAAPQVAGVLFTGSTPVARHIQRQLAGRLSADGQPVPLIAETGGVNAMVVDSSALAEQVVADVIASAFDSAGQRCSALRVLCVQDEVADGILALLRGAMEQLSVGPIDRLSTDVGPVITAEARTAIEAHVAEMARRGHPVFQVPLPPQTAHGTFVAPTLIEIGAWADVGREVFGPVLHVLRYRRQDLGALLDAVNASGYGLTFGLHTRLDATVAAVTGRVRAGNIYVNRNIIGAVVGVQPFGGCGLSGTGPQGRRATVSSAPGAGPPVPARRRGRSAGCRSPRFRRVVGGAGFRAPRQPHPELGRGAPGRSARTARPGGGKQPLRARAARHCAGLGANGVRPADADRRRARHRQPRGRRDRAGAVRCSAQGPAQGSGGAGETGGRRHLGRAARRGSGGRGGRDCCGGRHASGRT